MSPRAPPLSSSPAKTIVYPSVIHWIPVSDVDSSRPITGTATLMIVTSRITMKYPEQTATRGAQDRRPESAGGAGSSPGVDSALVTSQLRPARGRPPAGATIRGCMGRFVKSGRRETVIPDGEAFGGRAEWVDAVDGGARRLRWGAASRLTQITSDCGQ